MDKSKKASVSKEFVQRERRKYSVPPTQKMPADIDWYLHGISYNISN